MIPYRLKTQNGKVKMIDLSLYQQAAFDPKTGLPYKFSTECQLKENFKLQLEVMDEQDAVRRYVWHNLPSGLTTDLIERILYYRYNGMFFYMEANDKFYFLPFTLEGQIDVYGQFIETTPVPFNGQAKPEGKEKAWIRGLYRKVIYEFNDVDLETIKNGCVILCDYSKSISQKCIARSILQAPLLDAMSEVFPLARTNLVANSGIKAWRVNGEEEKIDVAIASKQIYQKALTGDPFIPIKSPIEMQDLTSSGSVTKSEEYLAYLQALDNYRLGLYGLKNGGLFQKKAHELQSEADMNGGMIDLVYQDGLSLRQEFCNLVNHIWDLGISCEPAESVVVNDRNLDGELTDEYDQSGELNQAEDLGGVENV